MKRSAAVSAVVSAVVSVVPAGPGPARAAEPRQGAAECQTRACRARTCRAASCRARVARKRAAKLRRSMSTAVASWYGPGLYGNRLGCGGTLTPGTHGVAHKSMACGSKLRLCYAGRCTTARVLDRGPYVGGRTFDLTASVKAAIGFPNGVRVVRWRALR